MTPIPPLRLDSWKDGERVLNELANILKLKGHLSSLRVDRHEISFRVSGKKTAADVARIINEELPSINNIVSRHLGVTIISAGVGDKTKSSDVSGIQRVEIMDGWNVTLMLAAAGTAAVVVIIVITICLLKGYDKSKDKLGDLQRSMSGPAETCKDYQDLCRARMTGGKNGSGNASEQQPAGRVVILSQENDRPPSSRSSTSSWSEEPALTNMDISTGHMVLVSDTRSIRRYFQSIFRSIFRSTFQSYMEDHLRNKGRLQREWDVLCRYEAEPSAREAALQVQCAQLNRPDAPLPYDHSRVVLNHLANAEGLDYINASTIVSLGTPLVAASRFK